MKNIIVLVLAVGFAFQAQAARNEGSISCVSMKNAMSATMTLTAREALFSKQNEASLWDVVATISDDSDETTTGRIDNINADENYTPRKYKNHSRFNLSKLTDTKTFGRFTPIDYCTLNLLVPNDGLSKSSFIAPVVISCDQNGGTISLKCTVTPRD